VHGSDRRDHREVGPRDPGEVADLAGLKSFRQYIADLLDAAQKAKSSGKSKDVFVKEADLPEYKDYSGYKDRFKDNAAAAYDGAK